jgi:hypothetical protein
MTVAGAIDSDRQLSPSQVRERVLADHRRLRGLLDCIERLVTGGPVHSLAELKRAGEELHRVLARHMRWEDRYLGPAVLDADAWGEERLARLRRDHREQREILAHSLERLRDPGRPGVLVARDLRDLIMMLRDDMEDEERDLLDPSVLRDDVVAIDLEAG